MPGPDGPGGAATLRDQRGTSPPWVEYRLLGPVEVSVAGHLRALAGRRQRNLLAALLLSAGQVVPMDRLIDLLWGDEPPRTASTALQGVVSQLRRLLGDVDASASPLQFRIDGYALQVEPGILDLHEFERLAEKGRRELAAGKPPEALALLEQALGLWRGRALGGVTAAALLEGELPRLEELRLSALEDRFDAALGLGEHAAQVPLMRRLVAEHPFRERLRGQLMLALYGSGRISESLDAYRQGRQVLAEELGLEPGGELQRLEQAILRRDPGLQVPSRPSERVIRLLPAQLPPHVADFTGREDELARLGGLLRCALDPDRSTPIVVAVSGQPGVGKSALALRAAHEFGELFEDGHLYADLGGAAGGPVEPGNVLGDWLRDLGLDGRSVPEGVEARSRLFRSRLAGSRMLLVLDDVAHEAQVRPVLPGSGGCAVITTSRAPLAGLESAHQVELGVLSSSQAVELLARIAGRERVNGQPEAATAIVQSCGRLPLGLRVAGARLAARPTWSLERLAGLLRDERRRLDVLVAGDLEVRASISLSYQALDARPREAMRLLGELEVRHLAPWMAAAVLDEAEAAGERVLEHLEERRLLEPADPDALGRSRYQFHDLLRAFARERLREEESGARRAGALDRVLASAVAQACEASSRLRALMPPMVAWTPRERAAACGWLGPVLDDPLVWFDAEREGLVGLALQAAEAGTRGAWRLAAALAPFFDVLSLWDDWRRTHEEALASVLGQGDREGEATVRRGLGFLQVHLGLLAEAVRSFERSLELASEGEPACAAWHGLHQALWSQGRVEESIRAAQRSIDLVRTSGSREEAQVLKDLAVAQHEHGQVEEARSALERSLAIYRRSEDPLGEASALYALGVNRRDAGESRQAATHFDRCLLLYRRAGDHRHELYSRYGLATALLEDGRGPEAGRFLEQARLGFEELGDLRGQVYCHHGLGVVARDAGRFDEAEDHLARGHELARRLGDERAAAAFSHALGEVRLAQGRTADAVALLRGAVEAQGRLGCHLREHRSRAALARALQSAGDPD